MKTICSKSFDKIAKSKYPKSETEPTNPWAVCTDKVGREDKAKYERCVQHIKEQNRKENKASETKSIIIEAKKKEKWIQDADLEEGSFTEYCGGKVTDECVQRGKKSKDKKTKQRAELAETFREMN